MFAQHDERAHDSAKGGWAQPREWRQGTRVIVGTILVVLVIAFFVGMFVFAGEGTDKLPAEVGV